MTLQIAAPKLPFEITAMTAPAGIRLRGEVDIATLPTLDSPSRPRIPSASPRNPWT
jgi:hypothetical protein